MLGDDIDVARAERVQGCGLPWPAARLAPSGRGGGPASGPGQRHLDRHRDYVEVRADLATLDALELLGDLAGQDVGTGKKKSQKTRLPALRPGARYVILETNGGAGRTTLTGGRPSP
jgi:hypothetical protein